VVPFSVAPAIINGILKSDNENLFSQILVKLKELSGIRTSSGRREKSSVSDRLEAVARVAVADQEGRDQRGTLHRKPRRILRQRL
jgi:hypothetical protein